VGKNCKKIVKSHSRAIRAMHGNNWIRASGSSSLGRGGQPDGNAQDVLERGYKTRTTRTQNLSIKEIRVAEPNFSQQIKGEPEREGRRGEGVREDPAEHSGNEADVG